MANCGKHILLNREGTEQKQRFTAALNPDWLKLNDFGLEEWMNFAWNLARHVNYFGTQNDQVSVGSWQEFFISKAELKDFLKEVESSSEITPHLALYVTFIQLLEFSKNHFNKLTKRHLDFYYHDILKLEKEAALADEVYVLFELAKNVVSEQIDKGTQLDAGKDSAGKKMVYKTTEELVVNQTKVSLLKNVYNDHEFNKIKAAEVASSFDGKGEELPNGTTAWWPFGHYENDGNSGFPELDDAKIGFAVAGEILELAEGNRNIQLSLTFDKKLPRTYSLTDLDASLEMYCTGEKGWLGPFHPVNNSRGMNDKVSLQSGSLADLSKLNILFQVPKEDKAIVVYDQKIHGETFNTNYPVIRILFKSENEPGFNLFRDLVNRIVLGFQIDVLVEGVRSLKLSNDVGDINAGKPFYPFGTQPVVKSKFNIGYPELYKKKWNDVSLAIRWKNTPEDFTNWYAAYRSTFKTQLSATDFMTGILSQEYLSSLADNQSFALRMSLEFDTSETVAGKIQKIQFNNLIVTDEDYFTAAAEILEKEEWTVLSGKDRLPMFDTKEDDGSFSMNFEFTNPSKGTDAAGPLRLSLNHTFLHEMYPRLYALAMSSEDKNVLIPNEPYTPFVDSLTLDYTASAEVLPDGNSYSKEDFEIYLEHPFGQAKENIEIKIANGIVDELEAKKLHIVPVYCKGGEFYIGLENALNKQIVSLLIQVQEGSENPEADSFAGKQKVEWWVLCSNDWKQLDNNDILLNETENLLRSGILRFTVPKEASVTNTLLPVGYLWLRARIHKRYDVVSKMISVHAQAVKARFDDNNNSQSQLADGLAAGTISKMVNRLPRVKAISQPFNSFGGISPESDEAYYRRISERLRHKNRAITLWDYEHLALQNFPEIHKVKCLNHTSSTLLNNKRNTRYLAPGNITLVVIPDIVNRNVFDIYKPRVSKATLNRIEDFFHNLISPLVQLTVLNPEYEEVRVVLKVQFIKGFDEVHYKNVLKNDLTRLLSPWAFNRQASIRFGISLHKSVVIHFIEKLEYVDFVSDLKMFQINGSTGIESEVNVAMPSGPEAILVSSKSHVVDNYENICTNQDIEPAESCQK